MPKSAKNKHRAKQYKKWKRYLSDSRLTDDQVIKRAKEFTRKGMKAPND